jgi:predicted nucleic acid-binding protein
MNVLVDTPVWSLALRRKPRDRNRKDWFLVQRLAGLVGQGQAQMIGAIRQELLSGIREDAQFLKLRDGLRLYDDVSIETADHEEAARMSNACRRAGIAGSPIDFLLCAVAKRRGWHLFTTDEDFKHYTRVLPDVQLLPIDELLS